jgi:hypothetical protein
MNYHFTQINKKLSLENLIKIHSLDKAIFDCNKKSVIEKLTR